MICQRCGERFVPDFRNRYRQRFCRDPKCRKASKAESQRKWLERTPDHFRGPANVKRVQDWRRAHPSHPRPAVRKASRSSTDTAVGRATSGNPSPASTSSASEEASLQDPCGSLQDFIIQNPLIIGLIVKVCGCALQEDIAPAISKLIEIGVGFQSRAGACERLPDLPETANKNGQSQT